MGLTRANSVCSTKYVVKIGPFPNATPTSKIWKHLSVDQKDQRRRSVWVRQADFFPKSPKEDKNSLNMSTACLFKKIDVQYAITGKCMKTKRKH